MNLTVAGSNPVIDAPSKCKRLKRSEQGVGSINIQHALLWTGSL